MFYKNDEQKTISEEMIKQLDREGIWDKSIVTKVEPYEAFYRAEEYHINYYERNRGQSYCRLVIDPKIIKLMERFEDKIRK